MTERRKTEAPGRLRPGASVRAVTEVRSGGVLDGHGRTFDRSGDRLCGVVQELDKLHRAARSDLTISRARP
ncbi:hypothetical protein ABZ468_11460 [Streptomyces sp. NPDC005708]|uniref:hypothetical protein n=1 Tax=Streptomyces sp. NPDC005708 TaxID=3154564 RepID=UPI0033D7AF73